MPGMDGMEATRRIRALPGPRGAVPIVALTAQAFGEQVELIQSAGMNAHVPKPADFATVTRVIADLLGRGNAAFLPATGAANAPDDPVIDRAVFDQVAGFIGAEETTANLALLRTQLLSVLAQTEAQASCVTDGPSAETVHTLASAAGMFGFYAVSETARLFEGGLRHAIDAAPDLGQRMAAAIRAALPPLDQAIAGCLPGAP
jgi:HPt (histidine-containing phosphotransfer) domain-containing protein